MNRTEPPFDDVAIDALLRVAAARDEPIADNGFGARVLRGLPPRRATNAERVVIPLAGLAGVALAGALLPADLHVTLPGIVVVYSWSSLLASAVPVVALAWSALTLLPRNS